MRPYLFPIALVVILCLPTRPFVLAWAWLCSRPIFQVFEQFQGRFLAIEAAAENKPEPTPPEPR